MSDSETRLKNYCSSVRKPAAAREYGICTAVTIHRDGISVHGALSQPGYNRASPHKVISMPRDHTPESESSVRRGKCSSQTSHIYGKQTASQVIHISQQEKILQNQDSRTGTGCASCLFPKSVHCPEKPAFSLPGQEAPGRNNGSSQNQGTPGKEMQNPAQNRSNARFQPRVPAHSLQEAQTLFPHLRQHTQIRLPVRGRLRIQQEMLQR